MVLTNYECWAHGSGGGNIVEITATTVNDIERHHNNRGGLDMFNPRAVSQISSNGYYGFSYVHSPTTTEAPDNNNNNSNNNNNNNNVIDINTATMVNQANYADVAIAAVSRCKKRIYAGGAENRELSAFLNDTADKAINAKRCRYDDDGNMTAQYCKDFFSLPVTQIGTQSCLMDIEEQQHHDYHQHLQHLQQQVPVDMAMPNTQTNTPQQQLSPQLYQQRHQQYYQDPNVLNKTVANFIQEQNYAQTDIDLELNAADMFRVMHGGCLQQFVRNLEAHIESEDFYADI